MKTVTEFDAFRLKTILEKKTELTTAGKTAEELPAALGEALKVEGDKLTTMLAALEVAEERQAGLKRVVVFAAEEGKSAPSGAIQKGDKWFLAEFFFVPQSAPRGEGRGGRDSRDGKRGGKRGGGRDGKRGGGGGGGRGAGRPDRGGSGDRANAGPGGGAPGEGGQRKPRPPRGDRPARPEGASAGPSPKPNVKPNVTPNAVKAAAPEAAAKPDSTPDGQ